MRRILVATRMWLVIHVQLAASLAAQTSVSVGPYVGYYRPFGHFEPASVYSADLPREPQDLAGVAFGGEADAWFGRNFGASVDAALTRGSVAIITTPESPRGPTSAHVETVVAQALVALPRQLGPHSWISGGIGMVRHAGDAYVGLSSLSQGAGVLGAGSRLDLNNRVSLTAGVTTLWYMLDVPMPPELRANPGSLERGRQLDVTFRLAASWSILRSER
jgi:hypothetical protein